jgi:uncharacterized membrane protein HdeD (DUF308 family)
VPNPLTPRTVIQDLKDDLEGLKREWYWFLILGVALVVIGTLAIGSAVITTLATVSVFGLLILAAGIAQVVTAFWSPRWSGVVLQLLFGLLYIVVGFMLVDEPIQGAVGLTLLLAVFLITGGLFRIAAALLMRFRNWGWSLLNGALSLLLGVIVWKYLLLEKGYLWVIGVFVGVEMIFAGWTWIMFALSVRNLPTSATTP